MAFNKSDIPALDFIIDRLLENDFPLYSDDLTKDGFISGANHRVIESEFENLIAIIKSYSCASVSDARNEDHGASVEKNELTSKFKKDGGFTTVFNDLQSEVNHKEKTEQKEQLVTDVLKLQKENFEHLKTIRNQESRIRDLEEQTKFIGLLKLYWWAILICLGIGATIKELWDIVVP